ncbi:hypothetical protein BH09PLA1_BH09PLA1_27100 [soil metagenome]
MRLFMTGVLAFTIILSFVQSVRAQQLTDYQQKIYDEVKAGLDGVEALLTDARAKLDAGDASGASGAYNTAVRNYNGHVRRLGQLPAGNADSTALRERAQTLGATLKETGAAIKAGPSKQPEKPGDKSDPKPAPPVSTKLDYKQEEQLKNARFHMKEVEPRTNRIFELTAGKLDAEAIAEALDLMKFVQQRMGYTVNLLNALPAENPEVAAESKQYNELLAKLVTAQDAIAKASPEADKQMAELGQQMTDDLAMVDSWSKSLGNPQALFDNRPDDAIAAVGQLPQMREAMGAMQQRWTARATEKPNDRTAADMVRKLKYVDGQLTDLEKYTAELARTLPERIASDLAEADKLIATAVSERRPMYFGPDSGIAQQLKFAEHRAKMLNAIDPAAAATAEKSLGATREKSREAQKSLAQDIIKFNNKPAERYSGADKEDLRQRVIANWKESHPNEQIVAVIFNTEGWSRTTRWDWSKGNQGFEKVDYEHIQPKLFYKFDDTHAVEMPVEVYKDYMKNERIVVKPWEIEKDPPVMRMYLLENLK